MYAKTKEAIETNFSLMIAKAEGILKEQTENMKTQKEAYDESVAQIIHYTEANVKAEKEEEHGVPGKDMRATRSRCLQPQLRTA